MRRGERTREHIIEQAAGLFNRKGVAGASLSDLMQATGLQKGGIYRHFASKEEIAAEAFEFAVARMRVRFTRAVQEGRTAPERLRAIASVYAGVAADPPVPGGCPVLSAAAEGDHGDPAVRARARAAMDALRAMVRRVAAAGVERGELRPGVDPEHVATVYTATLEGAVLLTQLYDDPAHVRRAAAHLEEYLEGSLRA